MRLDRGYQGSDKYGGSGDLQSSVRKVRGQSVTLFGKAYNRALSVLRVPVEHHFTRLKRFRILADLFRGDPNRQESIFCVVAGLLNFRATGGFALR